MMFPRLIPLLGEMTLRGLICGALIHSNVVGHTYNFADLVAAIHSAVLNVIPLS